MHLVVDFTGHQRWVGRANGNGRSGNVWKNELPSVFPRWCSPSQPSCAELKGKLRESFTGLRVENRNLYPNRRADLSNMTRCWCPYDCACKMWVFKCIGVGAEYNFLQATSLIALRTHISNWQDFAMFYIIKSASSFITRCWNVVFWDVTPCGSYGNRRFEGTYRQETEHAAKRSYKSHMASHARTTFFIVAVVKSTFLIYLPLLFIIATEFSVWFWEFCIVCRCFDISIEHI
jgi:hypothetical protein